MYQYINVISSPRTDTLWEQLAAESSGVRWGRRRPQRGAGRGPFPGSIDWFKAKNLQETVFFSRKIWAKP